MAATDDDVQRASEELLDQQARVSDVLDRHVATDELREAYHELNELLAAAIWYGGLRMKVRGH